MEVACCGKRNILGVPALVLAVGLALVVMTTTT
jgi:hypothetical protein